MAAVRGAVRPSMHFSKVQPDTIIYTLDAFMIYYCSITYMHFVLFEMYYSVLSAIYIYIYSYVVKSWWTIGIKLNKT